MGDKVTVDNITNVENSSGVPTINENFDAVADEFDNVHYRDGSQAATDDWDMDSNRILNLPSPLTNNEPVRLIDLEGISDPAFTVQLNAKADIEDVETLYPRTIPALENYGGGILSSGDNNRNSFAAAFADDAKRLTFEGDDYTITAISDTAPVHSYQVSQQPNVILPEDFKLMDGRGATLSADSGRGIVSAGWFTWAHPVTVSYLTSAIAAGDKAWELEAGEGDNWQADDEFIYRLGSLPYDTREPLTWGFGRIVSVASDTVTLDIPSPVSFDPASVAAQGFDNTIGGTWYNKGLFKWPISKNQVTKNITVVGSVADASHKLEEGFQTRGGRNISYENCHTQKVGNGFYLQYVINGSVKDCSVEDSHVFQVSVGKGLYLAEVLGLRVENFLSRGTQTHIAMEAGSTVSVNDTTWENTGDFATGVAHLSPKMFSVTGRSRMLAHNGKATGYGAYSFCEWNNGQAGYEGDASFTGLWSLEHPTEVLNIPLRFLDCLLEYKIAGVRELWDFANTRTWRRRIYLKDGMFYQPRGPKGPIKRLRIYTSAGLTLGTGNQLSNVSLGRVSANGANIVSQLVAGEDVVIKMVGGSQGGVEWTNRAEQSKLTIVTDAAAGLNAADHYIDIEAEFAVDRLTPGFAWSSETDQRMSHPAGNTREALVNYDAASVAAAATANFDLTVTNMLATDLVLSVDPATGWGGLTVESIDAQAGKVRVAVKNNTASPIDLAAQNFVIRWAKPAIGA